MSEDSALRSVEFEMGVQRGATATATAARLGACSLIPAFARIHMYVWSIAAH